jgi:hypothetical protein
VLELSWSKGTGKDSTLAFHLLHMQVSGGIYSSSKTTVSCNSILSSSSAALTNAW